MNNALTILKKELRDTLRDRRTVISMIVMPLVFMPLLIVGMAWFTGYQAKKSLEKDIRLGVVNEAGAPDLMVLLRSQDMMVVSALDTDPAQAVREKTVDIAMVVPPDWEAAIREQRDVGVTLLYNSTRTDSGQQLGRLQSLLLAYGQQVVGERFRQQHLDESVLITPAAVPQDVATAQERGGFFLGFLLPMFLVMWAVTGGMYTAIDVSAGEKERRTLEALLVTPVRRLDIVTGKLMAITIVSVTASALGLISLYLAMLRFGSSTILGGGPSDSTMVLGISLPGVLVILGASLLLSAMFSALMLSACIFAKGYREAQSYLTPMYLVAVLPVVLVSSAPGMEASPALFLVPAVNAVLLFKEVLLGILDPLHLLLTYASLAAYASVAVAVSVSIFRRETVLFRA